MIRLILAAALLATLLGRPSAAATMADVALVLAVDVSGSVTEDRFKLQREGIARALESDALAAAVTHGVHQAIEIAVVEWAEEQEVIVPWTVVHGRDDLAGLAGALRHTERSWVHTMTDPAGGIVAATTLFGSAPLAADRKVIDVSGDGAQNTGKVKAAEARDRAIAHDITINGLPITSGEEPNVDDWYRTNVVGGQDAFLVIADGFDAFAVAFQQKLVREVADSAGSPRQFAGLQ
jgi:hypothetical protein